MPRLDRIRDWSLVAEIQHGDLGQVDVLEEVVGLAAVFWFVVIVIVMVVVVCFVAAAGSVIMRHRERVLEEMRTNQLQMSRSIRWRRVRPVGLSLPPSKTLATRDIERTFFLSPPSIPYTFVEDSYVARESSTSHRLQKKPEALGYRYSGLCGEYRFFLPFA